MPNFLFASAGKQAFRLRKKKIRKQFSSFPNFLGWLMGFEPTTFRTTI